MKLGQKILIVFPLSFIVIAASLMIPAGSLAYWQGWVFCAIMMLSAGIIAAYFYKKSPEFLERRMRFKEKEVKQKAIVKIATIIFLLEFFIPGFDYRFGWSNVPLWLVIFSDFVIVVSYFLVFLAFKENPYAARTVEVFKGHKVISSGPYAVVRHPMYAGIIPMYLFMPLALGSFWALIPSIAVVAIIVARALNEEAVLKRDLPGYKEYCKKVHYRLIPFVW